MSTYLGWTVVSMPTSPVAPASLEVQRNTFVAAVTNPFTGQQQLQSWMNGSNPAGFYELSVSMPGMSAADGQTWGAFIQACDGPASVFHFSSTLCTSFPNELTTDGTTARYFRLKTNSTKWSIKEGQIYGLTFECREAI